MARRLLHIDRIEEQQAELQRRVADAQSAADRALRRLDEISHSDDPLANFVHGARGATFRHRISQERKQ